MSHFDPLEPEKRPKRPVFGHQRKKPNRRLRRHRNFGRFGTHLSPVALFVSELRPVFRRESVFTPDEYVFTGLVVRMYRFDVTACAEARRLVQRTESQPGKFYIRHTLLQLWKCKQGRHGTSGML